MSRVGRFVNGKDQADFLTLELEHIERPECKIRCTFTEPDWNDQGKMYLFSRNYQQFLRRRLGPVSNNRIYDENETDWLVEYGERIPAKGWRWEALKEGSTEAAKLEADYEKQFPDGERNSNALLTKVKRLRKLK